MFCIQSILSWMIIYKFGLELPFRALPKTPSFDFGIADQVRNDELVKNTSEEKVALIKSDFFNNNQPKTRTLIHTRSFHNNLCYYCID